MKSKLEKLMGALLCQEFPSLHIKENYRPDWLLSEDFTRLELDFYIESLNIAIEVQGAQHFGFVEFFHGNYNNYQKRKRADNDKRAICKQRGITLYEVFGETDARMVVDKIHQALNIADDSTDWVYSDGYIEDNDRQKISEYYKIRNKKQSKQTTREVVVYEKLQGRLGLTDDEFQELMFYKRMLPNRLNEIRSGDFVIAFRSLPNFLRRELEDIAQKSKDKQHAKNMFSEMLDRLLGTPSHL